MTLEHNTYKEAIADVKLSEDESMQILEHAIQRKERRAQKFRAQAVAAIAGILIIAFGANGICYAQTGMNIWNLLGSFYQDTSSHDLAGKTSDFHPCGESITYQNMKFTLESYYFDSVNGEVFYAIRTDSIDGTPLDIEAEQEGLEWRFESYIHNSEEYNNNIDGLSSNRSDAIINEDKTSTLRYYRDLYNYKTEGSPDDTLEIYLRIKSGEYVEDGITYHETIRKESFPLLPATGESKRLAFDSSALDLCTGITLTGATMDLTFDKKFTEIGNDYPKKIEALPPIRLEMNDGTTYYLLDLDHENVKAIAGDGDNADESGFSEYQLKTGEIIPHEFMLGQFSYGEGFDGYSQNGYTTSSFSATFDTYIDVDEIAAVYVGDVELTRK